MDDDRRRRCRGGGARRRAAAAAPAPPRRPGGCACCRSAAPACRPRRCTPPVPVPRPGSARPPCRPLPPLKTPQSVVPQLARHPPKPCSRTHAVDTRHRVTSEKECPGPESNQRQGDLQSSSGSGISVGNRGVGGVPGARCDTGVPLPGRTRVPMSSPGSSRPSPPSRQGHLRGVTKRAPG